MATRDKTHRRQFGPASTCVALLLALPYAAQGQQAQGQQAQGQQAQGQQPVVECDGARALDDGMVRRVAATALPSGIAGDVIEAHKIVAAAPDVRPLLTEDNERHSGPMRTGVAVELPLQTPADGAWEQLEDGSWAWRLEVSAPGAKGIRLRLENWRPTEGARLWVYNLDNASEVRGPFGADWTNPDHDVWTPTIYGSRVGLTYSLPAHENPDDVRHDFQVSRLIYMYQTPGGADGGNGGNGGGEQRGSALTCNLDVSCHANWVTESFGVGLVGLVSGGDTSYICSGALLNRTNDDLTPLFATATHCGIDATNIGSVEITWFYQTCSGPGCDPAGSCNSGDVPDLATLPVTMGLGVLLRGVTSDWTLLGLQSDIPGGVWFFGWSNAYMVVQTDVRGIHHPRGSWKRISFGDKQTDLGTRPDPDNVPNCEAGTAHHIRYAEGNGRVQPCSSGSPLLDTSARVRGVLSCAGDETCNGAQGASYGKIEHIWDSLAPYVDPPDPVYVDTDFGGARRGTVGNPFRFVAEGYFSVTRGSNLHIEAGNYDEPFRLDKAMTLHARNGVVNLGQ